MIFHLGKRPQCLHNKSNVTKPKTKKYLRHKRSYYQYQEGDKGICICWGDSKWKFYEEVNQRRIKSQSLHWSSLTSTNIIMHRIFSLIKKKLGNITITEIRATLYPSYDLEKTLFEILEQRSEGSEKTSSQLAN